MNTTPILKSPRNTLLALIAAGLTLSLIATMPAPVSADPSPTISVGATA